MLFKFLSTLFLFIFINFAQANVITVNTDSDIVANDGFCSFREAVESNRISSASGNLSGECIAGSASGINTINFQLQYPAEIFLIAPLKIADPVGLDIVGPGHEKLEIYAIQTQALTLAGGDFLLSGFKLRGGWNNNAGVGGALNISAKNVTLRTMEFYGSRSAKGGAVYASMKEGKVLTINSCIFRDNIATASFQTAYGGGLYVQMEYNSQLNIKNTTFQNNNADGSNAYYHQVFQNGQIVQVIEDTDNGYGGALYVTGQNINGLPNGTINISRSTFSGNYARWTGAAISAGGGLDEDFDGILNISHTTIHNNIVGDRNQDLVDLVRGNSVNVITPLSPFIPGVTQQFIGVGSVSIFNSIITGTKVQNLNTDSLDIYLGIRADQLLDQSFNIVGNNGSSLINTGLPNADNSYAGDENVGIVDPNLGALIDIYGGFNLIHMPNGVNSYAVDQGSCAGETRDQRDFSNSTTGLRAFDYSMVTNGPAGFCDIGAVEYLADDTSNFPPKLLEDYYHLDLNTALMTTDATGTTTYTINSDNGLLANDEDNDDDSLTLTNTGVQTLGNGSLELFADGTFSFTGHDLQEELSFTYQVTDGTDLRSQTAIIDLTPIPEPDAVDDFFTTPFNTVLSTTDIYGGITADSNDDGVLANDKAGAINPIYAIGVVDTEPYFGEIKVEGIGGTFEDDLDGLFTYTPPAGVSGIAIIKYSNVVLNGNGDNHATITIEVEQQSTAAVDDAYTLNYNQMLNEPAITGLLANDLNSPTITSAGTFDASPLGGTVVLQTDGSFTYTPLGAATGTDSFEYSVDDMGVTSTATVTITVTSPVAINDTYVIDEGGTLVADDLLGTVNGTNDDGVLVNDIPTGVISVVSVGNIPVPNLGSHLVMASDGSFTYTPPENAYGSDVIAYTAQDDNGQHTASITVTVNPINDNPTFTGGGDVNLPALSTPVTLTSWATAISAGPNESGQALNFVLTPSNFTGGLTFTTVPSIDPEGTLSFQVQSGSTGTVDIDVVLQDDLGGVSPVQSFRITIDAVNSPPIANPDNYVAIEDGVLYVSGINFTPLIANDTDADGNSLQVVNTGFQTANGIGGNVYIYGDGRFYYLSPANTSGIATFDYTVSDGILTDTATVTIDVSDVNDEPQLQDDMMAAYLEDSVIPAINVATDMLANDSPGPNEATQNLNLTLIDQETGGVASVLLGEVDFVLEQDFNGVAFFRYETTDNGTSGGVLDTKSAKAFVGFSITPVNDAPTFSKGSDYLAVPSATNNVVNLPNWVSNLSSGAANESNQTVSFNVSTTILSGNLSFISTPIIDSNTLEMTFTIAANTFGVAEVSITAVDSGDTSNGGANTSTVQLMQINIDAANDVVFMNGFEN